MQYTLMQNTIKHVLLIILGCKYVGSKIRIQREKIIDFRLRILNSLLLRGDGGWLTAPVFRLLYTVNYIFGCY